MLDNITVASERLFLDPNNPRFIRDLRSHEHVEDQDVEAKQVETLARFGTTKSKDEDDVTNIKVLYESMVTIGYVSIDRIVVKKIADSENYLVIEGNRRISTVKKILMDYEAHRGKIFGNKTNRDNVEPLIDSFKNISCKLLDTSGMSKEEEAHKISVILGLRHHGSLLSWEPLPRAYSIYTEYMNIDPALDEFSLDNARVNYVRSQLSIEEAVVKKALSTYIVYIQLSDVYDVMDKYYSLIETGVTDKTLKNSYFNIDGNTFKMDEESLEMMDRLCQFDKRDSINPAHEKKILIDPKSFTKFGKLVQKRISATPDVIKRYAEDLIHRVEDETDIDMTLAQAIDDLTNMEQSIKWVKTVTLLLDKQEKELKVAEYTGIGNDRANKDTLKGRVKPLRLILGI